MDGGAAHRLVIRRLPAERFKRGCISGSRPGPRHFAVGLQHFRSGPFPTEPQHLLVASGDQPGAQVGIEQDIVEPSGNVEDVLRVHHYGRIAKHFRQ